MSTAKRVKPAELIEWIGTVTQRAPVACAFVCVKLHRTDRLQALSGDQLANQVLHETVVRLLAVLHTQDRFALVSNDELWCMMPHVQNESFALLTAQAIQQALIDPFVISQGDTVHRTVQMRPATGLVFVQEAGIAADVVVRVGDEAASAAQQKEDRINSVSLRADDLPTSHQEIEAEVRKALFTNELEVFFQPQVRLKDNRCVSAEALVRLNRSGASAIHAGIIASVCQERGMMDTLTRYIINNVMRSQMTFKSLGFEIPISVNLSASTLSDPTFPLLLEQSAQTWGVSPHLLTLEITEGSIVENEFAAIQFMKRVRALGCELALDDFGTGYSSFAYLREFPISELKIDKLFVTHIVERDKDRRIVQALLELCKAFDLRSVCEGVEDTAGCDLLNKLGCDLGQGYHFSKAMPASDFIEWMHEFNSTTAVVA